MDIVLIAGLWLEESAWAGVAARGPRVIHDSKYAPTLARHAAQITLPRRPDNTSPL